MDLSSPGRNPDPRMLALSEENMAYLIYAHDSYGEPRGNANTHAVLCEQVAAQIALLDIHPGSRVLQFASASMDACAWEVVLALSAGASLHLGACETLAANAASCRTVNTTGFPSASPPQGRAAHPPTGRHWLFLAGPSKSR